MLYQNVVIETPSVVLPPVCLTSEELEQQLQPVYSRIGLHVGRLELMTGIRQRRFWPEGTLPSQGAAEAGRQALQIADVPPAEVDCLIHAAVSRDCVEPATSTFVHHALGLRPDTANFDLSNACLGMVSAITTLAAMIEAGLIRTGLAVSSENAGPLVRNTIQTLNNGDFNRQTIKPHFASLTIGSCATAIVVRHRSLSPHGHPLRAAVTRADTSHCQLCQGDAAGGMTDHAAPLMQTDSQELLLSGVKLAADTWNQLKTETGWQNHTPDLICTHQVGRAHRALLYESLGLDLNSDFSTFPELGNCGSASLPATLATAAQSRTIAPGANIALLGIGSGINCSCLALNW